MAMTKAQARAIGAALAVAILGGATWLVIRQMRTPQQAKVVVVEPEADQADKPETGRPEKAAAPLVAGPTGVVVDAKGEPVANAEVLLAVAGRPLDVYNTNADRRDEVSVYSDLKGKFIFGSVPAWSDLVVRCTQGFAHVRSGDMPADGRVVLQPWGRIEGVLRSGSKPVAFEPIVMQIPILPRVVPATGPSGLTVMRGGGYVRLSQTVNTDAEGRFVFTRVAPGMVVLARQGAPIMRGSFRSIRYFTVGGVDVQPGQTAQVEIGGMGRPVVGRIVPDQSGEELAFSGTIQLTSEAEANASTRVPENLAALSEQERVRIVSNQLRLQLVARSEPITVAPDGTFRAEDVSAGRHVLRVSSESMDPRTGRIETFAEGSLAFTMPTIPGGRSDEPLDIGTVTARVRPRLKIGAPAPALEAVKGDGGVVRLADYRGKYVLAAIIYDHDIVRDPDPGQLARSTLSLQDRLGGQDRLAMLAILLPQQSGPAQNGLPAMPGWTVATVKDWRQRLDPSYASAPGMYLIDPEGVVMAKVSPTGNSSYATVDRAAGLLRGHAPGVAVVMEKLTTGSATPAFAFKTIPTIAKDDVGQKAVFRIVDGRKADFAGELRILNDGLGPRHDRDESLMCTFAPNSVQGRVRADLGIPIEIKEINTYAWYKDGHRWAQVYRVYGSDGARPGFDPEPKFGTDPATCGWSFIAAVDTRDTSGGTNLGDDQKGQSGVSIRGEAGAIGKYRYLLFVTFATETHNAWGQTFWSEIDVVGR